MNEKRDIYIPCFQDMRMLHIYLPEDYEKETRHYPVLYMFDGHNLFYDEDATFGRSWGLKRWLDEHTMPLIVVGVNATTREIAGWRNFLPMISVMRRLALFTDRGKS